MAILQRETVLFQDSDRCRIGELGELEPSVINLSARSKGYQLGAMTGRLDLDRVTGSLSTASPCCGQTSKQVYSQLQWYLYPYTAIPTHESPSSEYPSLDLYRAKLDGGRIRNPKSDVLVA